MHRFRATLTLLLCFAFAPSATPALQLPVVPSVKPRSAPAASASASQTTPITPASAHPLTAPDLEAFFDGILQMQLERSDIAGASVLVMQDGNVLLKKGYGFSDVKKQQPVDPDNTLFRLASISKLSTWISVMQLVEQGKLDIDTDVNRYLDFEIHPAPHSVSDKPITLRNLMTHTGGFEENIYSIITTDPKQALTLRDFIVNHQPRRLFAPGTVPAYSNYGVGLASYIVQRVSGEPFEQYTQNHIYAPLRMSHSTFAQPLPKQLSVSEGYRRDTTKPPVGFETFNPVGAGGYSSTAADMGRLGSALLNGGELDGARILKPETLAAMWTPQFQASNDLPPICMGFYQVWRSGLRWIGHEGDLIAFHSLFFVEPTHKLVLFVAYNSAGGGARPRPEIINMFSDRYFPTPLHQSFATLSRSELKAVEGNYFSTRRADSTLLRLFNLPSQRTASVNKEGVLTIENFKNLRDHPARFKPLSKDLWQEIDGQDRLFTIRDDDGRIVRIAVDFPGVQVQRVPSIENRKLLFPLLAISLCILLAVVLAPIVRLVRRILFPRRPQLSPQPGTTWLPRSTQIAAAIWVVFAVTLLSFFASQGDDLLPPNATWHRWFLLIDLVVGLAILFSVPAILSGIRVFVRELRWITRVKFALVALATLFLTWFSIHFHLIGQTTRI